MINKLFNSRGVFVSLLLSHVSFLSSYVNAMDIMDIDALPTQPRIISTAKEIEHGTAFGKRLSAHQVNLKMRENYICYLQDDLLPKITSASLIHMDHALPTAIDATGNKHDFIYVEIKDKSNQVERLKKREFNKSNKQLLAETMLALAQERTSSKDAQSWINDESVLDVRFTEPQKTETIPLIVSADGSHIITPEGEPIMVTVNKLSFKSPRWAAVAVDNLSLANPNEISNLINNVLIFKDASKIELPPQLRKNRVEIYFSEDFAVPTAMYANKLFSGKANITIEVFRDWENVGGGYTAGARMQEECNLHSSPDLGHALIIVEDSKKALEGDDAPKTIKSRGKDVLIFEPQEVDIYNNVLIKRDNNDRILSGAEQFRVNWLFSPAFDLRDGSPVEFKPKLDEDYMTALQQKRTGIMKAAAYSQQQQNSEKLSVLVTGASGTGIFENKKELFAQALKTSVDQSGNYFDVIIVAGMQPQFQPEILKMVQEQLNGIRLQK